MRGLLSDVPQGIVRRRGERDDEKQSHDGRRRDASNPLASRAALDQPTGCRRMPSGTDPTSPAHARLGPIHATRRHCPGLKLQVRHAEGGASSRHRHGPRQEAVPAPQAWLRWPAAEECSEVLTPYSFSWGLPRSEKIKMLAGGGAYAGVKALQKTMLAAGEHGVFCQSRFSSDTITNGIALTFGLVSTAAIAKNFLDLSFERGRGLPPA